MDEARWRQLVARLDERARATPRRYRRRVVVFALFGYAVLAVALIMLLGLLGLLAYAVLAWHVNGYTAVKLLLVLGTPIGLIGRSMAVRIEPPEGIELAPTEVPELATAIHDLSRAVRGPRVHRVVLDDDLNAGVVQVPRFGVVGSRNHLLIGLPLLQVLSPLEFRAVLAHELAHLSRSHGRIGVWLYRIRATWGRLFELLEEERSAGRRALRAFAQWYVPRLHALTFPLMRAHELEADRLAGAAVGATALGSALGRLAVADAFLGLQFWPSMFWRAAEEADPPSTTYSELGASVHSASGSPNATEWLRAALHAEPDPQDTHPTLAQRLEALGVVAPVLHDDSAAETAADAYLGARLPGLCERMGVLWQGAVADAWQEYGQRVREERTQLRELEERQETLDPDELFELAQLTESHRGSEEARTLLRKLLAVAPEHAPARYELGRLLLGQDDDAGFAELERAMELDPDAILPACQLAAGYLAAEGRKVEAASYRARAEGRELELELAWSEREVFAREDPLLPTVLDREVEEQFCRCLEAFPEVERASIGSRADLQHLADELPHFVVLAVVRDRGEPDLPERLSDALDLPGSFHVIISQTDRDDRAWFEEQVPVPLYESGRRRESGRQREDDAITAEQR